MPLNAATLKETQTVKLLSLQNSKGFDELVKEKTMLNNAFN